MGSGSVDTKINCIVAIVAKLNPSDGSLKTVGLVDLFDVIDHVDIIDALRLEVLALRGNY